MSVSAPARRAGYYLVNGGSSGAGVIWATGNPNGTANSVFLGTTRAQIMKNLDPAIGHLGVVGLYEANASALASTAVKHGTAWYRSTPSNVAPDNDFIIAAASLGLGGELGVALKGVLGAADLTDPLGINELMNGNTDPTTSKPWLRGGTTSSGTSASDVEQATNPEADDASGAKDSDEGAKDSDEDSDEDQDESSSGDLGKLAFLAKLDSGHFWLRALEFIFGVILACFALVMFGRIAGASNGRPVKTRYVPIP